MPPYIADPAHLADATDLLARFGPFATEEAEARADAARRRGNVVRFCAWRQVGRLVAILALTDVAGTRH